MGQFLEPRVSDASAAAAWAVVGDEPSARVVGDEMEVSADRRVRVGSREQEEVAVDDGRAPTGLEILDADRTRDRDAAVVDPPEDAAETARVGVALDVVEAVDHIDGLWRRAVDHLAGRETAGNRPAAVEGAPAGAKPLAAGQAKTGAPSALPCAAIPERNSADLRDLDEADLLDRAGDHLLIPETSRRRAVALRVRFEERERAERSGRPGNSGRHESECDHGDRQAHTTAPPSRR